jgi:hypothetical protein
MLGDVVFIIIIIIIISDHQTPHPLISHRNALGTSPKESASEVRSNLKKAGENQGTLVF